METTMKMMVITYGLEQSQILIGKVTNKEQQRLKVREASLASMNHGQDLILTCQQDKLIL